MGSLWPLNSGQRVPVDVHAVVVDTLVRERVWHKGLGVHSSDGGVG